MVHFNEHQDEDCQWLGLQGLLGKKWSLPLLLELKNGEISFNQLRKKTSNRINPTLLSSVLKQLIRLNIVQKEIKGNSFYKLTTAGSDLVHILMLMKDWAKEHHLVIKDDCKNKSCLECEFFIGQKIRF